MLRIMAVLMGMSPDFQESEFPRLRMAELIVRWILIGIIGIVLAVAGFLMVTV